MRLAALAFAAVLSLLGACQQNVPINDPKPVAGHVTDMKAFQDFIAGKPTPAQFRATYPDVLLILPGDISTRELRLDNSRYFAELDADGRINGGKFK
ncbi:hypothetical protein [Solimonas terrae]|uniref:Lipoprotein n=1 Tax=Solimonas terrae TaxID=1396819 RepID=A0A6M2BV74_9GAMM|nr:hypothetical protein [Solimonas terrae]NGY06476.1 hypothetical protein [Solimonas terrae]